MQNPVEHGKFIPHKKPRQHPSQLMEHMAPVATSRTFYSGNFQAETEGMGDPGKIQPTERKEWGDPRKEGPA